MFVFQGELFEQNETFKRLKNLLVDFFGGNIGTSTLTTASKNNQQEQTGLPSVYLEGLDYVISVTASNDDEKVHFRTYAITLYNASDNARLPRVELSNMGPFFTCTIGRTKFGMETLQKQAYKTPKALKVTKTKNVSYNGLGEQYGRIHNPVQDFSALQTRKTKALKKSKKSDVAASTEAAE